MSEETVGSQGPWDIEHDDGEWHFFDQRLGAFIFFIAGACALTLLVMLFVRDYYWRHNGQSPCRFFRWRSPPQSNEDLHRDRAIAEELQRQLNQEERETERQAKRNDRRKWYESYMKPFTVTVREESFFYAHEIEDHDTVDEPTIDIPKNSRVLKRMSVSTISEEDDEELEDVERGRAMTEDSYNPVMCQETEADAHLYARITVDKKAGRHRIVDGQCAICVCDYEPGDEVVFSGLGKCRHAFHKDCILPWLSKGKKRCPICRNWFVPGSRIEDQKKALEARLEREASEEESSSELGLTETERSESTFDGCACDSANENGGDARPFACQTEDSSGGESDSGSDETADEANQSESDTQESEEPIVVTIVDENGDNDSSSTPVESDVTEVHLDVV